jgi:DNA-binding Xre family transcriptional regulator
MLNTMTPMTVRWAVSEILDNKGMSTAEFAEKAKITYNTALSIRRGVVARIDLETISKVCSALGIQPGDLFKTVDSETD